MRVESKVPIFDGKSENIAHMGKKKGLFKEEKTTDFVNLYLSQIWVCPSVSKESLIITSSNSEIENPVKYRMCIT